MQASTEDTFSLSTETIKLLGTLQYTCHGNSTAARVRGACQPWADQGTSFTKL